MVTESWGASRGSGDGGLRLAATIAVQSPDVFSGVDGQDPRGKGW